MLAGGGDALGLGSVAADAITVFGAFLDTGSVPVNDPLAVLVAGASMSSVRVLWQTVQVKVRTPSSVQVGSFVTTPSFQVCWPVAGRV